MKKKIFIAIHYMEIGGVEISLIGLLNAINYEKYDVDLFVYSHQGELMKLIPSEVNLLREDKQYAHIERPMVECLKTGCIRLLLCRLWVKLKLQFWQRRHPEILPLNALPLVAEKASRFLPDFKGKGKYDLAISFLIPHNIVLDKVDAKKKIAWIHTDYTKIGVDVPHEIKIWQKYDFIASISEDVTKTFLTTFPTLKDKILEIHNILSPSFVRSRSKERAELKQMQQTANRVNLLSIGRFSDAKNFDNVPDILRRIREKGIDAYWYIIGYGSLESFIRQKIKESEVDNYVILLGKKDNPYPYINACNLYVQPSRYEGNSVAVREAQMLCKPVVVTNYATAKSQINDGLDGVIVPMDNDGCAAGIVELIKNKEQQQRMVEYLHSHDYGNENEVEKIYKLID